MSKGKYTSKEYAELLEWGLNRYMPTKISYNPVSQHAYIFLKNPPPGLEEEEMTVEVSGEGALKFEGKIIVSPEAEYSFDVLRIINKLNRRSGVTLYVEKETVCCLCARQELYMDHLTMAAAKRTAERIVLAISDMYTALNTLSQWLPEYFSEEMLCSAKEEGAKELTEWQDQDTRQMMTAEEFTEYLQSLVDASEWDEDEDLPF